MRFAGSIVALLLALCLATPAHAHATLVSTDPGDNSVMMQAPKMMQLRFNEAVTPMTVQLIDAEGKTREVTTHAVDQSVLVALPDNLPQGSQIISYRVVSQDGHPVGGSIMFSVGGPSRGAAAPARDGSSVLVWFARIGVYLGLFVGVGGVFFAAWIGQGPGGESVILSALYIGLASAIASLGLQGLDLLGLPPGGIFSIAPWKVALGTSLGPSLLLAIAAMLMARLAWRSPSMTIARCLTALAMVGAGSALAASGHASTASPQWLARPSVFLHGVGVAYWVGALAPLAVMARCRADTLPGVLKRFSAGAVPIVGLLALTGLALAWVQLASVSALIQTQYGILLVDQAGARRGAARARRFQPLQADARAGEGPHTDATPAAIRIHRMLAGTADSCGRCRVALHSAAAGARRGGRRAAIDPHPHGCRNAPDADRSGKGRCGRLCAAIDGRKLWSACGQGSHAGAQSAGTKSGGVGAEGRARF